MITTVAGPGGTFASTGDGGPAALAQLGDPMGIATDHSGNLYITENHRIRKIDARGIITTIAGPGGPPEAGITTRVAVEAFVGSPISVLPDNAGNIFFGDGYMGVSVI